MIRSHPPLAASATWPTLLASDAISKSVTVSGAATKKRCPLGSVTVIRTRSKEKCPFCYFTESFDDATKTPQRGFPSREGGWLGDLSGSILAETDLKPNDCERIVRLSPDNKHLLRYAWRIVEFDTYPMLASTDASSKKAFDEIQTLFTHHPVDDTIGHAACCRC